MTVPSQELIGTVTAESGIQGTPSIDETQQISAAPHLSPAPLIEDETQPIRLPNRT